MPEFDLYSTKIEPTPPSCSEFHTYAMAHMCLHTQACTHTHMEICTDTRYNIFFNFKINLGVSKQDPTGTPEKEIKAKKQNKY